MKIKDYKVRQRMIPIPGAGENGEAGKLMVRGLNLTDITRLVENHLPELLKLVGLYQKDQQSVFSDRAFQQMLMEMVANFPLLTAEMICLAADQADDESIQAAAKFGAAISIQASIEIGQLTLEEAGGLKNLSASLAPLLQKGVGLANQSQVTQNKPSPTSTGD